MSTGSCRGAGCDFSECKQKRAKVCMSSVFAHIRKVSENGGWQAEFGVSAWGVVERRTRKLPTPHAAFVISPCRVCGFDRQKSVQKQSESAHFAMCGLQNDTLELTMKNEKWKIIGWGSMACEKSFDLRPSFYLSGEKCHPDDFKRFWRVSENRACKQKRRFAYILSISSRTLPPCVPTTDEY